MPKKTTPRKKSAVVKPLPEQAMAQAILDGIMSMAKDQYGVISVARFDSTDTDAQFLDMKNFEFTEHAGVFFDRKVDGEKFLNGEQMTKYLAKRLDHSGPELTKVILLLFKVVHEGNKSTVKEDEPEGSYQWIIDGKTLIPDHTVQVTSEGQVFSPGPAFLRKEKKFDLVEGQTVPPVEYLTTEFSFERNIEFIELILLRAPVGNHHIQITSDKGTVTTQFNKTGFITTMDDAQVERLAAQMSEAVFSEDVKGISVLLTSFPGRTEKQGFKFAGFAPRELRSWFITASHYVASDAEQTEFAYPRPKGHRKSLTTYQDAWEVTA